VDDVSVPLPSSRFATTRTPSFTFGYSIVFTSECTLTNANFWLLNGQRRTQQRYSDQQKTQRKLPCPLLALSDIRKMSAVSAFGSKADIARGRGLRNPRGGFVSRLERARRHNTTPIVIAGLLQRADDLYLGLYAARSFCDDEHSRAVRAKAKTHSIRSSTAWRQR
jgi:hypothetical protein